MMYWIPLILISFAGGVAHTLTGFGCGLIMMMVFPYLMPMVQAAAMNSLIGGCLSASLIWKYRQHLKPDLLLKTAPIYLAVSVLTLQFVQKIDTRVMGLIFGIFLTALGLYYLLLSAKARLHENPVTLIGCSVFSGMTSAMFGIGGPLMSLLFVEHYKTREEYAVNLQVLFVVSAIINTATRAIKGIVTASLIPTAAAGIAAILLGEQAGLHLAGKMKPETLKKMIYYMIILSGAVMIVRNI